MRKDETVRHECNISNAKVVSSMGIIPLSASERTDLLIDQEQIRQAVISLLDAVGEDIDRDGLSMTPSRVAAMYSEMLSGIGRDPTEVLQTQFDQPNSGLVVFADLPFFSLCEHHLLPFMGTATVGYLPSGRVVGASKVARALDILSHRLQIQERLTQQLADALADALLPKGVGVVLSAEHLCMSLRGVNKPGNRMVTSAYRGEFETSAEIKREFLSMRRGE